jgi:hypothetical protein
MDIDNICIALQKSNNNFEDQIEFLKTNYNKVFMTMVQRWGRVGACAVVLEVLCIIIYTEDFQDIKQVGRAPLPRKSSV